LFFGHFLKQTTDEKKDEAKEGEKAETDKEGDDAAKAKAGSVEGTKETEEKEGEGETEADMLAKEKTLQVRERVTTDNHRLQM
jgi:hypothetical protein